MDRNHRARGDVLVIDNWAMAPLSEHERREICADPLILQ